MQLIISGGAQTSINFNAELILNAMALSFDHDVTPTESQNLQFTWACKQATEV